MNGENPYEKHLKARFEYADLVTFAQNKVTPRYNWFYYKEGYSRDFVWSALKELSVQKGELVVDPFCGTGTTLLAAKQAGYDCAGFDILPLGAFVSRVKLEDDYDVELIAEEIRRLTSVKFGQARTKLVDVGFIDMKRAFNQYARNDLPFFKERIMEVEDDKTRNLLLLGLLSIVGEASNVIKDGGVLKIVNKHRTPPVRHLLKNRLKRMLKDLRDETNPNTKISWTVEQADARQMPLEDGTADALITSPPYLNNVDYTKVYALELSLLISSYKELEALRKKSMRSHISAVYEGQEGSEIVSRAMKHVTKTGGEVKVPPVVEGYLMDLYLSLKDAARVLKKGGCAAYVVGNTTLPGVTVDVDLMIAQMWEDMGYTAEDIWVANARWAQIHGVEKQRPVRESAVVLRK